MPKLGNMWEINAESDYQRRCNPDGSCSGCGECCSDLLLLSEDEVRRIRAYVKKYNLKPHYNPSALLPTGELDSICPFRDNEKEQCDIYSVRPQICRSFICSQSLDQAHEDMKILEKRRKMHSMRYEFFGDLRNTEMFEPLLESI